MPKSARKTKGVFHKFFIPHEGNNYHPHILHTKRAVAYSTLALCLKVFIVGFAVLLPAESFLSPDVLAEQGKKIVALVDELRAENGLKPLTPIGKLTTSAQTRANDMLTLQYFSHNGPDGHTLKYFLSQAGYDYSVAGENLAMGFSDAQEVVDAWIKSPTHYANMINKDYTQDGLGLVAGNFDGVPTVFVAQHFGLPNVTQIPNANNPAPEQSSGRTGQIPNKAPTENIQTPKPTEPVVNPSVKPPAVGGVEVTKPVEEKPASAISIDPAKSTVTWQDVDSRTKISANVTVTGPVTGATVDVNGFDVPLKQTAVGTFVGTATMPERSNDVFKVVTSPSVKLDVANGQSEQGTVAWAKPKIVSQTPWQRYVQANSWLGHSIPLFAILRALYLLAFIFFALALAVHLYVQETRKYARKHFIWLQTVGMLVFLVAMIKL